MSEPILLISLPYGVSAPRKVADDYTDHRHNPIALYFVFVGNTKFKTSLLVVFSNEIIIACMDRTSGLASPSVCLVNGHCSSVIQASSNNILSTLFILGLQFKPISFIAEAPNVVHTEDS
ncbi:hypothetical protein V6N13_118687 [Hibiscus sabdariffa]|uniref:Uncharacterized protein n=1 Tax=Hibiscus sabdariffa TaxID=183260 RepID=A0ABR2E2G3_9ROSI